MVRKLRKQTTQLVGASVALPIGLSVASRAGASTAAMGGLTSVSGYMGTMGTLVAAGAVLRGVQKLQPKRRRKRR